MDGGSSSNSPPPFLTKTYDIVDDPATDSVVSWSQTSRSFVVWNQLEFARDLLPKYFKHNNFSSFVRQLNTYGFRKIDPDQWEFANDEFIRGQRHLLKNIHRRKPVHSHSLHQGQGNSSELLTESEKQELQEKIEKLKQDKGLLISELQKCTQQQYGMEKRMQSLEERLLNVDLCQKHIIYNLTHFIQKPQFLSNLVLPLDDVQSKKRRLPKSGFFFEDEDSQAMGREKLHMVETFEKIESSLNSLEDFFRHVSEASCGDMYYDGTAPSLPSGVVITELHTSSDMMNLRTPSPISSRMREVNSSPELAESTSCDGSPALLSLTETRSDTCGMVAEIDVNSEPTVRENDQPKDRTSGRAGANDVFWEQFLNENPGSSDTKEAQSEKKELENKRTVEFQNSWWSKKNVDHLADKIGLLSHIEKT